MENTENLSEEFSEENKNIQEELNAKPITKKEMMDRYMEQVLEQEKAPRSVFKFAKEHGFAEAEFHRYFGSMEDLKSKIWTAFYDMTVTLTQQNLEYGKYSNQEKMLTFYYTYFELLTLNRSYVLFALGEEGRMIKSMSQLAALRKKIIGLPI